MNRTRKPWWRKLGPGIISGTADNDPTTVATLAVIGSTTGYVLGWVVLLVIPMLAAVQAISGRVGAVTGRGLESVLRRRYGWFSAMLCLVCVFAVNQITLAADLEGGAAALQLLTGIGYKWFLVPLAVLTAALLVFGTYQLVQRFLIYTPLAFIAYAAVAFWVHPDWHTVLHYSFVPYVRFNPTIASGIIALLGTTLTAYAYVWETIEMSEERPKLRELGLVQFDATLGIVIAGLVFWFILIGTAATLGVHHHAVQTAQDAASALEPIAGSGASVLFGIGLLGSALIALPVLSGTSAYVTAEMFGLRRGIDKHFRQAPQFFGMLLATITLAVAIAFAGVPPIRLLFIGSIAGGLATPVTLYYLVRAASDEQVMGAYRLPPGLRIAGWIVFAVVSGSAIFYLWQVL